jgi:cell division protein FtsQ
MSQAWQDIRVINTAANGLFAISLAACLAAGLWWLSQRPSFAIRQLLVSAPPAETLNRVQETTLRLLPLDRIAGNFFLADLRQVRSLIEMHAWVRSAKVRRVWPDTLAIEIEEHRPFALWNGDRMINTFGESFSANPADVDEDGLLPRLSGPDGEERKVQQLYLDLLRMLAPTKLHPEEVELSDRRAWRVLLSDGTELLLGREGSAAIAQRIASWIELRPELARRLPGQNVVVDLRYPAGFSIRLASAAAGREATHPPTDPAARANRASGTRP